MSEYETVLFVARECFVYRVPPRSSTAGYKAGEWGDMEAFLWKGRLRIMESSNSPTCSIRLEDGDTGELFAECPYDVKAPPSNLFSTRAGTLSSESSRKAQTVPKRRRTSAWA